MSWKKYGGINNFEKMSDLTVNNLVADHTTSKYDFYSYEGVINYLYGVDLLNAKNISVLQEEVYLDVSMSEYLYGYLGNIGVNTKTPVATFDISGTNPLTLNVYADSSYNQNIIARNKNNRKISVYVNNSYAQLQFPDANITERNGVISIETLSATDASINTLAVGELLSMSDISINLLNNVDKIYFGTNASYIEVGSANTDIRFNGSHNVDVLTATTLNTTTINNSQKITTNSIDANDISANSIVANNATFDTVNVNTLSLENIELPQNVTISNLTVDDVSVNDILTIPVDAKLIAYGDISANNMYVSGNLTVDGTTTLRLLVNESVQDLTVTNDASFNDVTVNGTFTTNSTVAINDGATIVGDLNCTASTIIQW